MWTKDPDEELDFAIDWSTRIGDDTINTSTWVDVDSGITVGTGPKAPSISEDLQHTVIWLSGGTPGVEYELTNRIVTLGGRTYDKDVFIRIDSAPAVLPDWNGCDWPVDPACLVKEWDEIDDTTQARAISLASATLYRLTGYRVGGCPVTVRPTTDTCLPCYSADAYGSGFLLPMNYNGAWTNCGCGRHDPRLVPLPGPVGRIDEVKVDGVVVDPGDYTIANPNSLAWIGGGDPPWPQTQDVLTPDTQVGTFSVTYLNSYPPDGYAAYAAGLMAMEFGKACSGKGKCRLPSNITSIVRQGVSYELVSGAFPDGKTNIREVDGFIEQWNPKGRTPNIVIDPGAPKVFVQR